MQKASSANPFKNKPPENQLIRYMEIDPNKHYQVRGRCPDHACGRTMTAQSFKGMKKSVKDCMESHNKGVEYCLSDKETGFALVTSLETPYTCGNDCSATKKRNMDMSVVSYMRHFAMKPECLNGKPVFNVFTEEYEALTAEVEPQLKLQPQPKPQPQLKMSIVKDANTQTCEIKASCEACFWRMKNEFSGAKLNTQQQTKLLEFSKKALTNLFNTHQCAVYPEKKVPFTS